MQSNIQSLCFGLFAIIFSIGWVQTKEEQIDTFYRQADFGYVKKRRNELVAYCQPEQQVSYLSWTEVFIPSKTLFIIFIA